MVLKSSNRGDSSDLLIPRALILLTLAIRTRCGGLAWTLATSLDLRRGCARSAALEAREACWTYSMSDGSSRLLRPIGRVLAWREGDKMSLARRVLAKNMIRTHMCMRESTPTATPIRHRSPSRTLKWRARIMTCSITLTVLTRYHELHSQRQHYFLLAPNYVMTAASTHQPTRPSHTALIRLSPCVQGARGDKHVRISRNHQLHG